MSTEEISLISRQLSIRDRCIFVLGIRTGLRISEVLSLDVEDVLDVGGKIKGVLRVQKQNVKGSTAGRVLPLHLEVIDVLHVFLKEYKGAMNAPLFRSRINRRLDRGSFHSALKKACTRASIQDAHLVATHSMRKTFANTMYTALERDLFALQEAMDHSSISTTVRYLQPNKNRIWNAIKNVK